MIEYEIINRDGVEVAQEIGTKGIVLLTDPPFGISLNTDFNSKNKNSSVHRKVHDDHKPFDPTPWLAYKKCLLFGGNNFASRLPDRGAWIVWDKVTKNGLGVRIAEAELAWVSCLTRTRVFRHMWSGAFRDSERGTKHHPCQKPVILWEWILDVMKVAPGDVVFDPYCGSGSLGRACIRKGISYLGCEIDPEYAALAKKLCDAEYASPQQPVQKWRDSEAIMEEVSP